MLCSAKSFCQLQWFPQAFIPFHLLLCRAYKRKTILLPLDSDSPFQVARKLVIIEGDLERTEERAELAES